MQSGRSEWRAEARTPFDRYRRAVLRGRDVAKEFSRKQREIEIEAGEAAFRPGDSAWHAEALAMKQDAGFDLRNIVALNQRAFLR